MTTSFPFHPSLEYLPRTASIFASGQKCNLKTSLRPGFKTGLQDGYEDLKTLTDLSFWRRIFKAIKTSNLDVLQPKFNAPVKTSDPRHYYSRAFKTLV